ncbi:allatostatin-A receptor isoform X2 [Toxorhynchites rutilus septentrionalis]|uniref:allatostatin-A receptor isoform X2 n=1 Tax=Toxorhynchites rutilus septentrionalis TaxID=329112 RepID=UPI0024798B52|nr:allatostatin-A receptor isoform X2 [Toxorhynchites rutilus septentrionalis]
MENKINPMEKENICSVLFITRFFFLFSLLFGEGGDVWMLECMLVALQGTDSFMTSAPVYTPLLWHLPWQRINKRLRSCDTKLRYRALSHSSISPVVAANPSMRSTTNLLIINLAAADLLFIIFCVPFTATDYILSEWPFGLLWCKFVQYMIVVTAHASAYTLVLMSLDRFLAVVHPITSMTVRTEKNASIAIAVTWFIIVTTGIPVAISHGVLRYPSRGDDYTACLFLHNQGYSLIAFHVSFFLSSYVIPLMLISILYMGMLVRLWKGAPGGRASDESRRGKKRVTRMVVVVVFVFAMCWCPIQVILVLKSFEAYEVTHFSIIIQIVAHVLAYTNSCINPVLYAFLSDNFRKAFRKVIWCGKPPSLIPHGPQTKTTRTGNGTSNADGL